MLVQATRGKLRRILWDYSNSDGDFSFTRPRGQSGPDSNNGVLEIVLPPSGVYSFLLPAPNVAPPLPSPQPFYLPSAQFLLGVLQAH